MRTMGFFHQLRLLLWKNFTLKKRSPLVVVCEMCIPLVLFVILLLIRKKLPATKMPIAHNHVRALPSTGLLSLMQIFCDGEGEVDQHGFLNFSADNQLHNLLGKLQTLAEDHDFFRPGMSPEEMDDLPEIYQEVIDDPAFMIDAFRNASDIGFGSILQDTERFRHFMVHNLSIPKDEVDLLIDSKIRVKEIYHYIFGGTLSLSHIPSSILHRFRRDTDHASSTGKGEGDHSFLSTLSHGMDQTIHSLSSSVSSSSDKILAKYFEEMVSKKIASFNPVVSQLYNSFFDALTEQIGAEERDKLIAQVVEKVMFSSGNSGLDKIISTLKKIFEDPEKLSPKEELKLLEEILKAVEDYKKAIVIQPVWIARAIKSVLLSDFLLRHLACDNDTFVDVVIPNHAFNHSLLMDLQYRLCHLTPSQMSQLSREMMSEITDKELIQLLNIKAINVTATAYKVTEFLSKAERFMKFQIELEEIYELISLLPFSENMTDLINVTTPMPSNSTPYPDHGQGGGGDSMGKGASWRRIWDFLHKAVCGKKPPATTTHKPSGEEEDGENTEKAEGEDMGMSRTQQQKFKIIVHYLYNNPAILYAPNGTSADKIIQKANTTIAFIELISDYAHEWLNISHRLHLYLHKPKTRHNLALMKKMQEDIREHHSFLSWMFKIYDLSPYLNMKIRSADEYDHQLSLIDYGAHGWLHMMKGINLNIFRGFASEEDMLDYFLTEAYRDNASIIAGVVFEDLPEDGSIPYHLTYKIRQNATYLPSTKQVRRPTWVPGPGGHYFPYYQFGFMYVQDMIERAVIDLQVGRDVVEPGVYAQQFPYPCYVWDQFMFMIEHVMPLCLTFSWVYTVSMLVQSIVYEKEQRLKEVMKMMGLSNAVHWCAWFLTTFGQMTISVVIMTCVLKMGNILPNSNVLLIFFVLEVYVCTIITFSFLISVLYSKAKVAAACAGIIYFLSYVPYMYIAIKEDIAEDHISGVWKTLASMLSTTAFGLGGKYFAFYEEMGVGVQWSNISVSPSEHDEFNLLMVILMMVFDCVFYSLLVWYIEHVHPGSYGLPKPWYFPFLKSYWCGTGGHLEHCSGVGGGNPLAAFMCCHSVEGLSLMEEDQACAMGYSCSEQAQRFESDPIHLPLGVCIDNLTKVYKLGKKTAVKNLSLNLYEGQITSFLGHNGAGKTTTMSMLTGMIPPSAGTASIYNCDIRSEMDDIRQSLGMCPQHNVLFDKFTVEEHLWFYAKLKGMKSEAVDVETNRMIDDLGLPDKRHVKVDCLSGGMQRKLSVAIAFVGGSRTVILDEPTAGVDPYARRAIWDLLVKFKKGRTILLSTHHMDEADFLGDRIAIISNGQLKCCGSSIFLKNMIGEGYHLTLSKAERRVVESDPEHEEEEDGMSAPLPPTSTKKNNQQSPCRESEVSAFVKKYVSSAYLVSETTRELHYILPFEEVKKGCFEKLFSNLDDSLSQLKVDSYGVMDTSLEEIFLKVTEAAYLEEEAGDEIEKSMDTFPTDRPSSPLPYPGQMGSPTHMPSPASMQQSYDLLDVGRAPSQGAQLNAFSNGYSTAEPMGSINHGMADSDNEDNGYANLPASPLLGRGGDLVLEDFSSDGQQRMAGRDRHGNGKRQGGVNGGSGVAAGAAPTAAAAGMPGGCFTPGTVLRNSDHQTPRILLEGRGSHMMHPKLVLANHFKAVIIKRFHYITRNWRSLFSQIILPAIFVAVAMTVALAAPSVDDMPPLELSPIQYLNVTRPRGNYIPFTNERMSHRSKVNPLDANAYQLQATLAMPSGVGASCVLKSPDIKEVNSSACYNDKCRWMIDAHIHMAPDHRDKYDRHYINTSFDPLNPSYSTKEYYPHGCYCKKDGNGFTCRHSNYDRPPGFRAVTLDMLSNITGQRSEDYLLFTTYDEEMHRYGGLSFGLVQRYVPENFGNNAPTLFKKLAVRNVATMWFNHKGYHAMPVYLNAINNAILRANLPTSKGNPAAYGITLVNHPWNDTNSQLSSLDYILEGSDVLISIFIIAAMSFVPASFVVFLVYERSTKAKHLQFVTGMNPVMYWIGNYVWDMANYVIPAFMCVMILLIFQIPAYVSSTNLPAVVALFLMYGWSMTPVMYPASFWFKEPSSAYIALIVINLFTGITCIVSSFLLEIFSYDPDLERVHKVLKIVFMMFPNYCLGRGLMELAFNEYRNEYFFKTGQMSKMHSAMEWDIIPCHLVAMASVGLIFFCITLLCEYRFFLTPGQSRVSQTSLNEEDRDVSMERKRVLRGNGKYDSLVLENLTKVYKTRKLGRHLAVDRVCLGVPPGECFGLLGVNGAGKTTTFKMLTGDLAPTAGCAYLNGYSVVKDIKKVQQSIGYCPQFDSLYDELTAREHLQLYCRLRGIPSSDEHQVVEWAIAKLGLTKYADKLSGTYSGGNKRKLSTAIALIGHPPIIFMDEPTTGMDPHSRRFLWDLIQSLIQDGRSVILTSHSMEECEALCTRLAIMVNGTFKCIGSSTHLKNRFGDGYTFTIRIKGPDYDRGSREVMRFIERNIPGAIVKEQHYNIVQYELKTRPVSLAMLFSQLEKAESDLGLVEDYSVSQNTLDNVFINFVKQQTEIVQDEEGEEESRIRSFSSRLRTRASNLLNSSDEPMLIPRNQSDDSLDLSDDEVMLTLDDSDGSRLTLMPL